MRMALPGNELPPVNDVNQLVLLRRLSLKWICIMLLALAISSCKKSSQEKEPPVNPGSGIVRTPKGAAIGPATTSTIGSAGGQLQTPDGAIKVIVPAGAVSSSQTFSIQKIANTLDSTTGRPGYRLLPEGIAFAQPVTVTMAYTAADFQNSAEDLLVVAWQKTDGAWKVEPTELNKTNKTVSVNTTHFSDWVITGGFKIQVPADDLLPTAKDQLTITGVTSDDLIADLLSENYLAESGLTFAGNWRITDGPGTLVPEPSSGSLQASAEYEAPRTVNGRQQIVVSAELGGFNKVKDPSRPGGVRATGKMILFGRFFVSTDNFLDGSFNGTAINIHGSEVTGTIFNGMLAIRAENSQVSINIFVQASGPGLYPCGDVLQPGNASVTVDMKNGAQGWGISYFVCPGPQLVYAPEHVKITSWPQVGKYAEGFFVGDVYQNDGCTLKKASLNIWFRFLRTI